MTNETLKKVFSSWAAALVLAIFVGIIAVVMFGHSSYDIDGARLGFGVAPAWHGVTELSIPPFGEITASTHKSPVAVNIVLEKIYPHEISQVADKIDDSKDLLRKIVFKGKKALKQFMIRLIALAAIGGAIGAALSPGRRTLKALAGAFLGAVFISGIIFATYSSYNVYAFKQPRYSGVLSVAPWATEDIAKRIADIKAFRHEVLDVARNVDGFYSKIDAWQPIQCNTIKVLHVSDIHNNPLAIDLIKKVVRDFHIDFIIDTGDITDYGTPVETTLIDGISNLPVPYVFVAGNHESPQTIAFMKGVRNVTVLDGNVVNVKGITIIGFPDPSSANQEPAVADESAIAALRAQIIGRLNALQERPLILAVHNPKVVKGLLGKVPIILVGHTHKADLVEKNGYVENNAGTTGAAGLRTFQTEDGVPYTLSVLHIDRSQKRLVAIDSLEVTGTEREFRLERNLIEGKTVSKNEVGTLSK